MAFDFTLSRLKLQTKIADITNSAITTAVDSVTNTISAAETVINVDGWLKITKIFEPPRAAWRSYEKSH